VSDGPNVTDSARQRRALGGRRHGATAQSGFRKRRYGRRRYSGRRNRDAVVVSASGEKDARPYETPVGLDCENLLRERSEA